jgi:hypothetical protein
MLNYYHLGAEELGIRVYKNAIPKRHDVVSAIVSSIDDNINPLLKWNQAMVGHGVVMPSYRNCWDCKLGPEAVCGMDDKNSSFKSAYNDVVMAIGSCVEDFCKKYRLNLSYMEAVNFVKYGVGEHFDVHSDHGFSYICTVSTVAYLNDDYEGGELWFKHLDQKIKPEAGDIVVFPSNFIYSHASLPVTSGVKYSAVTMFDYTDTYHKNGGY